MGAVKNKQIRNMHAKCYIEAVFADRLRAEGFVCPDDKLLCWYRVVNGEVIHSVCFFSRWSNLPLMMEIAYGMYPLFLHPFRFSDVHTSKRPDDERFYSVTIMEEGPQHHYAPYTEEILVYAPKADGRGLYTLEQVILPQMNAVQSLEQCYRFHREKIAKFPIRMTRTTIDEAIWLNDTGAYPDCMQALDQMIPIYQRGCERQPTNMEEKEALLQLQQQKHAIEEDAREEYLATLDRRVKKTTALLDKKWGITI